MDWEPEQLNLGALGFAGICRETFRVLKLIRAIHPANGGRGAAILSALFLAQIVAGRTLNSSSLLLGILYTLFMVAFMLFILLLSIACTASYVVCVATLYCTDGDPRASHRVAREVPEALLRRHLLNFITLYPFAYFYITLSALAWVELPLLDPSDKVVVLALQVLGGAAFLAGAAYVVLLSHIACVVALLEDFEDEEILFFGTVRKSRALLAGNFWAAAAVFLPLDGCFLALQTYFPVLVFDDVVGLGRGFQVAAGVAMAVALWAVVAVTLVAQPVVYLVCKNHHNEIVDKVHLNYAGEYQRLDIDGDSGVELQQVETTSQPTATSAQATPQPAVLPTPPAEPPALLQATSAQE